MEGNRWTVKIAILFSSYLFIKELAAKLHPTEMEVMMAVPPKEGDRVPSYSTAYDYTKKNGGKNP
ncbi:hypothetical protein [Bacillus salipaludis]|uniref:Uncharacterized protein n=1 Tax=Bacillus salipaludis TaxID=2547811 RepID=A0ABW8RGY7_9BACI